MLLLAVMCVACNPDSGKKKISIAYANWLEGIAMSHLAKVVLEEKGYEVELLNADVAPVFASVSRKKADVFMDAWLPVTMKDYIDQYGDQIEFIGEVYDSARVGLVVPQYVTIDSIGELAAHKGQFSSEIVGIDAGAGIMKTTDKAKFFSNIKFTTEEISSLMKALKDARMDEEDLVRKWRDEHRELVESWIPES